MSLRLVPEAPRADRATTLHFEPIPLADVGLRRREHFARLHEPPELYLELLVPSCLAYELRVADLSAGHVLVTSDGTLVELALTAAGCRNKEELFGELCQNLGIQHVFCYSFDSTLMALCIAGGAVANPHGMLWREFVPGRFSSLPALRPAVESDIDTILPHRDNLFDTEEQVVVWVHSGWVYVLEEDKEFVGVGLCSPVWSGTPQRDVGVMVHPTKRGLGYGQRIVASLAERCLRTGLVPTAGCAQDNVASQRTLLRAGFISRHSLFRFDLGTAAMAPNDATLAEVARSLTGDARLLPFLPELLQDLGALGLGTEPVLNVLAAAGLDARGAMRVLDLGCGKGEALIVLAEKLGWRGEGVDLMPAFILEGRSRARDRRVGHLVRLEVGHLVEAAAEGEQVDIVLFGFDSDALGSLSDSLRAVQKRLSPSGYVVLSTAWRRAGRPPIEGALSEAETRDAVRAAGLAVVSEESSTVESTRAQNEHNTAHIRRRANALASRFPNQQSWFDDYVKAQEQESRQLEEDLVCSVLLLERRG